MQILKISKANKDHTSYFPFHICLNSCRRQAAKDVGINVNGTIYNSAGCPLPDKISPTKVAVKPRIYPTIANKTSKLLTSDYA